MKARQAILSNGLLVLAGLFALLAITVPLDLAAEAYQAMDQRRAIKVMLTPNER